MDHNFADRLAADQTYLETRFSRQTALWPDLLKERAEQLAQVNTPHFNREETHLICQVQGQQVVLELLYIRYIMGPEILTPLPQSPTELKGICAYRGQWVSVLDFASLLQLGCSSDKGEILLLRSRPVIGLWIDKSLALHISDPTEVLSPHPLPFLSGSNSAGMLIPDLIALSQDRRFNFVLESPQ